MTYSNCINSIGLISDIIGAGLLWRYGLPAPISRGGVIHLILEQVDEAEKAKAMRYDRLSLLGMALLVFGFLLQLISDFVRFRHLTSACS
jgi:hypothetical protein